MSDKEDQIDIEIEDAAPEEGDVQVIKAEDDAPAGGNGELKKPKKDIAPEEGIESLKKQLEDSRIAEAEAKKRARESAEAAHRAQSEVQDTNLHLISSALDTAKRDEAALKASYRDALAADDFDMAADLQAAMSNNAIRILQLEQGKQSLESTPKPKLQVDPVEQLASQLSPRSADWVRRNPQCATDPRLYQKMIAAHTLAVADGYQADTDEYFEMIEDTLRINRREPVAHDDAMESSAKVTQRRSAPPSAPVSRSSGGPGTRPNVVRLTSAEREIASMMGMSDQEYARNKLALQKEGKLN